MTTVSMSTELHAPAADVWKIVSDFNGLTGFISAITESTTQGSGVGAVRTLILEDGTQIIERLENFDKEAKKFSYSIVSSPLPLEDYLATVRILEINDQCCKLEWSSSFQPRGVPEAEAKDIIEGIYSMAFKGLQKLFGN
ncbi:MAG: SRPBCC family protein [Deltaproteobacteria bacterium]|nr:SRPBCC family protein [Deltaproteobacteria bacterium]